MFFIIGFILTIIFGVLVWRLSYPIITRIYLFLSSKKFKEEHPITKIRNMLFSVNIEGLKDTGDTKKRLYITAAFVALALFITRANLFFTAIFGVIGFYIPLIIAKYKENKRLTMIDRQLADGLVLVTNSLRSGLSFAQGLEVLSEQGQSPLKEEFKIVTDELRLGVSMEQALNNLGARLKKSREMKITITAINIARETGGNMSEALETIAETMRKRNEMFGKISALTAQGRLSGVIVTALPFALGFVINLMDPVMMRPLYTTVPGYFIIVVILFLIAVGWLLIKKIISIDI